MNSCLTSSFELPRTGAAACATPQGLEVLPQFIYLQFPVMLTVLVIFRLMIGFGKTTFARAFIHLTDIKACIVPDHVEHSEPLPGAFEIDNLISNLNLCGSM